MTLSSTEKQAVVDEVRRLFNLADNYFGCRFPIPEVSFRRSGKNAGTAFLQQYRINFNPVLLAENKHAFFQDVIPHEVSHLITFRQYGKVRPHGREWQAVMRQVFAVEPATTHNFDLSSLQIQTFAYRCRCQNIELSVRRHNNVRRGAQYRCRRCGEILVFNG